MIFQMCFTFLVLDLASALADKDDVEKLINERNKLLGRSLPLYPTIRPHYSGLFPGNQLGVLDGVNPFPLGTEGLGLGGDGIGRLYNPQYRIPVEFLNFQQLFGQKLPTNDLTFPYQFGTAKDSSYAFLPQTRRQLAARALLSPSPKFSVEDLINLLLIQLLTRYEDNYPEEIMRTYSKYPVDQPLLSNINQLGHRLQNPPLQLSSYLSSSNDPRNHMPYSYQKRGRSLNEKPANQNEFIHKSNFEASSIPSNAQNNDNLQNLLQKDSSVVPMFNLRQGNDDPLQAKT